MDAETLAAREWVEKTTLTYICATYALYRGQGRAGREPSLSVGALKGYLDQAGPVEGYRWVSARKRYVMLQAALDRLVRAGKLQFSYGIGVSGRETRCYEPIG